ncbi:MAG TPA: hypothetical protein VFB42_14650 [Gaiellaceae bacterium]|nr:hypothetical protein [Gaiellaceae bacterium]
MAARSRRSPTVAATLASALALVPAAAARPLDDPGHPTFPTLYVVYAMNCTFSIVDDAGRKVSSIAPGTYQIEVSTPIMFKLVVPGGPGVDHLADNDFTGCRGWVQFQLTGPGVNLFTTLDSGCDAFYLLPATTFQPGATYTAQDLNQPALTRTAITTLTSGAPPVPVSPYGPTSGKGQLSTDIVGSAIGDEVRATLSGTLSAKGKATLTSRGKPVSILKAGRYKFSVKDASAKRGFTIQALDGKPIRITEDAFVGRHARTVKLTPGRWTYSSGAGVAVNFLVTR